MATFLETDERHDVFVSLQEFDRQLDAVEVDSGRWKFALIAVTLAVNGALVCFLSGTMQTGALRKREAKLAIEAMQLGSDVPRPKPFLAAPSELLERATGTERYDTQEKKLSVSEPQKASFKLLTEFRNQFIHFHPAGWVVEVSGLPKHCAAVLEVINTIREDGYAFLHLSDAHRVELDSLLVSCAKKLERLDRIYNS